MIKDNRSKKIVSLIMLLFTLFNSSFIQLLSNNLNENPKDNIKFTPESSSIITELWSYETQNIIFSSPALGDIDNDGKLEVILRDHDWYLYALNGEDGSECWIVDMKTVFGFFSPSLADIDGDGKLEVIIGNWDGKVYAYNGEDGTELWNFTTGNSVFGVPAIGDVDNDGKLEVVVGSKDNNTYAINGEDGSELWKFPTEDWIYSSPALGDVDGDGKLEVVFGDI